MNTQIIQNNGDLKREVWSFDLVADHRIELRLTHYSFQTKETKRHKWQTQNFWDRYDNRNSLMSTAPYSTEAVSDAKQYFIDQIKKAEVQK